MTTGRINQVARDEWEMRNTHAHTQKGASAESHTNQTPGIRHETERHTAANAAVTRTAERNSPEVQSKQERSPYQGATNQTVGRDTGTHASIQYMNRGER